ncbi:MAG: ERAP1-like C-terminal domain-containing protein, partial [Candidatus Saccharimonadales bacterium]
SVSKVGNRINLSQQQFFIGNHQPSDKLWPIPLNSTCSDMPELMTEKSVQVTRTHTTPLRFNVGDGAHFITKYDQQLLSELVGEVKADNLSPLDRAQLLNEQTLLARGNILPSAQLIPLLDAYKLEQTEAVWDIISMTIGELKKFVEQDETSEKQLRALGARTAAREYERLGWHKVDGEPDTDTKQRATILGMTLYGEQPDVINAALTIYRDTTLDALDPELRPLILSAAVRHGDDSIFDELLATHKLSNSAELQQDIASALTSTKSPGRIDQILALLQDETVVRPQDAARWFIWTMRNRDGRNQSWEWLQANWGWIVKTFGGDKSYDDFPRYAAGSLVTRQQLDDYRAFFTPMLSEPALARVITMGISEIEARVELIERDSAGVHAALAQL